MAEYKDTYIRVGNRSKGYALFNQTQGEFITGFDYYDIFTTTYGVHFLYKTDEDESCIVVGDDGKEVPFDKDYFWGGLVANRFGIGNVLSLKDNKYYLADFCGNILSKGYDRQPKRKFLFSRVYEVTNIIKESGRKMKGLMDMFGREFVSCEHDYISEFDDIFVLLELIEKHGPGVMLYASGDIIASDKIFLKILEASIKSLRNLPDNMDKYQYICQFAANGMSDMWGERNAVLFDKHLTRQRTDDVYQEVFDKFKLLIEELFNEGVLSGMIIKNCLEKSVSTIIQCMIDNAYISYIYD